MDGFKSFLLRGNLVEIAVGLIMALAFTEVVTTFTDMLMGFIGKIGDQPDFSTAEVAGVTVGLFINALIAFVLLGAVVYFLIVVPYTKARKRFFPEEVAGPTEIELLTQIRDALAAPGGRQP